MGDCWFALIRRDVLMPNSGMCVNCDVNIVFGSERADRCNLPCQKGLTLGNSVKRFAVIMLTCSMVSCVSEYGSTALNELCHVDSLSLNPNVKNKIKRRPEV